MVFKFLSMFYICVIFSTDGMVLQGVGPNLAISFSVYDTARSYWQLQRLAGDVIMLFIYLFIIHGFAFFI